MKNSAKISKPLLDWIRWIIVFAILSIVWSGLSGYDGIIQDSNPIGFFIGFSVPGLMIFTLPGLFIGGLIALMSKKNNTGLSVLILVNSVISVGLFYSYFNWNKWQKNAWRMITRSVATNIKKILVTAFLLMLTAQASAWVSKGFIPKNVS